MTAHNLILAVAESLTTGRIHSPMKWESAMVDMRLQLGSARTCGVAEDHVHVGLGRPSVFC
jgi:hypothetical protein